MINMFAMDYISHDLKIGVNLCNFVANFMTNRYHHIVYHIKAVYNLISFQEFKQ